MTLNVQSGWHDWLEKKLHQSMLTSSHRNRIASSNKQNALNMFNSCRKAKVKPCTTGISAPCHSSVCSNNKAGHYIEPQKIKRLKTIKQRNQLRGQSTNSSNRRHQRCERASKDKGPCSEHKECQCSRSVNVCGKEKPIAKPFIAQKPSIITEGRLTSIRGLFSYEVRSVDIERLVKEKKNQKYIENKEGQDTASLIPHSTPPVVISETSEEGTSARANKHQKSNMLEKTDCFQTDLGATVIGTVRSGDGKHNTASEATDNTARPGNTSGQKGIQEDVILTSSESEIVHKSCSTSVKVRPSDHKVIPKKKNTHEQKHTLKATAEMDVQHYSVNTERLDMPARSEVLNSDAPLFNTSPAIFMFSSPTLDRERSEMGNESQHRKPGFSSKEEAMSRLATRLCHDLDSFPSHRCCPLLTECRKVLLTNLQERHGSQLQHSLRRVYSHLSAEGPRSPHTAKQVWPSSGQKYLDNTQTYLSCTRKHESAQQSETMEFQTDNCSEKHCLRDGFCEYVEKEAASKRKQTWGMYSPQDFATKLQRPCKDLLSQWSEKAQFQGSLRARQHSNSQMLSVYQAFTAPQTCGASPWSYNCADQEPQKQLKLGTDEYMRRHSTPLTLLEQWRNDPDLNFLFQDENPKRTHASLGSLTEWKACSPPHDIESISERPLFGASSTVSAFFPPEGFCYEPYYRFPHPSNSFNRSGTTLYTKPKVEKTGHGASLHLTPPYF